MSMVQLNHLLYLKQHRNVLYLRLTLLYLPISSYGNSFNEFLRDGFGIRN